MATNRIDTLDPALIRPGRIDRKIEFPLPDIKTKRRIFTIHTSRMTLADDVDVEEIVTTKDDLSGADVKVCVALSVLSPAQPAQSNARPSAPPVCPARVPAAQAVCTEAGLLALRERRMKVTGDDFKKAKEKVMYRKNQNLPEGLYL